MNWTPGVKFLSKPGDAQIATSPPALPSVFAQARNFAGAVVRTAKTVAKGKRPDVAPEVAAAREAICRECAWFRANDERCGHPRCGCFTKIKVWLSAERCPETPPKW